METVDNYEDKLASDDDDDAKRLEKTEKAATVKANKKKNNATKDLWLHIQVLAAEIAGLHTLASQITSTWSIWSTTTTASRKATKDA